MARYHCVIMIGAGATLVFAAALGRAVAQTPAPTVVEEIRREAAKQNNDPGGRPLPLAAHWQQGANSGTTGPTYNSFVQRDLILQGHHLLPNVPMPGQNGSTYTDYSAYEPLIKQYAAWDLPMTVRDTNTHTNAGFLASWGSSTVYPTAVTPYIQRYSSTYPSSTTFSRFTTYFDPQGPIEAWQDAGQKMITQPAMAQIQQWYPDPKRVLFLSNNEDKFVKGQYIDNITGNSDTDLNVRSKRFIDQYGLGHSRQFKNHVVGAGYARVFGGLIDSMRYNLASPAWQQNATFVGYNAFGPSHYGRWTDWDVYSEGGKTLTELDPSGNPVTHQAKIDYSHLAWDGGSPSYYTSDTLGITDYQVYSIQVEVMNWVFMQKKAYAENPNFWFELSVWDGTRYTKGSDGTITFTDKAAGYIQKGQTYSPERYKGMVQFGMWMTTPRVVREFRGWSEKWAVDMPEYFEAVMDSVDVIYENATLERFWRKGELVANRTQTHPYRQNLIAEFANEDRWFLLDTSLDPDELLWGSGGSQEIKLFSMARVLGEEGRREWLLYAYSPLMAREDVTITIPGYQDVVVDVPVEGGFWLINEATGSVTLVVPEPAGLAVLTLAAASMMRRRRRK